MESDLAFSNTVRHNLKSLTVRNNRMLNLICPLGSIECVNKANDKILIIGPRNEWDFFLLRREGFAFKNLTGLDLISYSPKIDLGDMHEMRFYEDDQFDIILSGWTLSYSSSPAKAVSEMKRVVRNNGFVGLAVEYFYEDENTEHQWTNLHGYYIQEKDRLPKRINAVRDLLGLFGESVKEVFWQHDAPLKNSHRPGALCSAPSVVSVIVQITKEY